MLADCKWYWESFGALHRSRGIPRRRFGLRPYTTVLVALSLLLSSVHTCALEHRSPYYRYIIIRLDTVGCPLWFVLWRAPAE